MLSLLPPPQEVMFLATSAFKVENDVVLSKFVNALTREQSDVGVLNLHHRYISTKNLGLVGVDLKVEVRGQAF